MTAVGSVIVAVCVAFVISLVGTPTAIRALTKLKAGQPIRDINPAAHSLKRGTPTMGGLVFIGGTLVAYVAGHLTLKTLPNTYIVPPGPTITGLVLLGLMVFCGAIGFWDDFLKVQKRNSNGLNARVKLLLQLVVGAVFGTIALFFAGTNKQTVGSTYISFVRGRGLRRRSHGHDQRCQPDRWPRWARHRRLGDGARRLRADRVLAVPALVR